jgi:predicted dehydrogenase
VIKIGIIGGGLIASRHIEAFSKDLRCSVKVMLAQGSDLSKHTAAFHGLKYTTDKETFFEYNLDAVIICSPNATHSEYLDICISKNLFVLVEKPLFSHYDEHKKFDQNSMEFLNKKVLVAHHRHHFSKYKQLKKILSNGEIGEVIAFHGFATWYKPEYYFDDAPWRTEQHQGGPLRINAIHDLLLIMELFGEFETVQFIKSNRHRKFDVEDSVAISFKSKSGVIGTFLLSDCAAAPWSWEFTVHENKTYPRYDGDCYFVAGSKGSIQFPSLTKHFYAGDPDWWSPIESENIQVLETDPFKEQAQNFLDMIYDDTEPLVSYSMALAVLKILKDQTL